MLQEITCQAPSNIALVKYWGKYGTQLPLNPSVSLTLSNCYTETALKLGEKTNPQLDVEFYFEGKRNAAFESKVLSFIKKIEDEVELVKSNKLIFHSKNTFPHSSGIASSASGMAALVYALCGIEGTLMDLQRVSYLSRLASGSACRSIFPKIALWGKNHFIAGSSNDYAIPVFDEIDEIFHTFCDAVILVDEGVKSVSSSAGHALMNQHPFKDGRIAQANQNIIELLGAMKDGDLETFGKIVETEALSLHALMMSSDPSYVLMKPASLAIIEKIRDARINRNIPMYFTLDAGPNIHLLYPNKHQETVKAFINEELKDWCDVTKVIYDSVGNGPTII